jgi:hypothetical protein
MTPTEDLINQLAESATPVRRLRPPLLRASLWLLGVLCVAAAVILAAGALQRFAERSLTPGFDTEWAATVLTGMCAVLAAFNLSLPDRSRHWLWLPVPSLLVWLGASGFGCYRSWLVVGADQSLQLGESARCFLFILAVSVPLAIALSVPLRRSRPLDPMPVLWCAGLGVAALSAAILQFFHPFNITVMDLASHLAAIALAVLLVGGLGRQALRRPAGLAGDPG